MASRRSRIKAIASIPQRRKPVDEENIKLEETGSENQVKEETCNSVPVSKIVTITKNELKSNSFELMSNKIKTPIDIERKSNMSQEKSANNEETASIAETNIEIKSPITQTTILPEDFTENKTIINKELVINENNLGQVKPVRRKFIKPTVNIITKKSKVSFENSQETNQITSSSQELSQIFQTDTNQVNNLSPTQEFSSTSLKNTESKVKDNLPIHCSSETEITLNEIHLSTGVPSSNLSTQLNTTAEHNLKLPSNSNIATAQIEPEYPPPPPSPSIPSRVRIKAIPKLRYRKTSFSASESEDETRKSNRIRNDSVCSSTSVNTETPTEGQNVQKPREISTIIQKKCNRTEQTRKLAEARREFQRRFGSNAPDRQKLTMMDLIFYNPDTNPMDKQDVKLRSEKSLNKNTENESVDDPTPEKLVDNNKSDEENDVPVPQIKIGPTGEIILDEKSIFVERKEIKKQREEIAKSEVVNGDFDTNYGIYKKHKRSKFWTTDETLRFYKALNTLGTDFTLMCELFPDRTRRELKMKFNKEEKINRTLIDKALMQPCGFDFYVLKEEVELEQREKAELEKLKMEENKKKEERKEKEKKRLLNRYLEQQKEAEVEKSRLEEIKKKEDRKEKEIQKKKRKSDDDELNLNLDNGIKELKNSKKIMRRMKRKRLDINAVLDDTDDADESDISTNSEDEVISCHKPTRSGRMPKVPRKFDVNNEMVVEKIVKKSKDEIEPGSIMIVTEDGPTGEPIYKIFMITQDQEKTALELNSDDEAKAFQLKKGISAKNILTISATHTDDEEIDEGNEQPLENNVTIPADETVTTLKSIPCPNSQEIVHRYDQRLSEENKSCNAQQNEKIDKTVQFPDNALEEVKYDRDKGIILNWENDMSDSSNHVINTRRDSSISFDEPLPEENNITIAEDTNITSLRSDRSTNSIIKTQECVETIRLKTDSDITDDNSTQYVILNDFSPNAEKIEVD